MILSSVCGHIAVWETAVCCNEPAHSFLMPGDSHVVADRTDFDFLSAAERAGRTRYNASRIRSCVIVHIGRVSAVLIFVVRTRRATLKVALPRARRGSEKLVRRKRTKLFYAAAHAQYLIPYNGFTSGSNVLISRLLFD